MASFFKLFVKNHEIVIVQFIHYTIFVFYMKYLIAYAIVGQIYLFVRVEKLGDGMEER